MANTGKDASGNTIYLRAPFGTGVDNTNAYNYGSAVYFQRDSAEQLCVLDTSTAANNRPLPVLALSADGAAPFDTNSGAAAATTLRSVLATRHEAAATPLSLRLSDGSSFITNLATNLAQVNGNTTATGNGVSGTGVLRVTVASDSTGTLAATQSGTWNITNVSGTVSLPTGAATAANQATEITALQLLDDVVATDGSAALTKLYQVGGTDGTNAQILSTNASGHLNIADGGNSITVDGTVAATQSGTWTVTGTGGTFPVTDSGGSLTVDNAGTFAVQAAQSGTWNITNVSGTVSLPTGASTLAEQQSQTTSLQLIDDAIVADNAGFTDGTTKLDMAGYIYDEVAGTALTENDAAAARINVNRAQVHVIEDGATRGRYATVTAANAVKVDGSAVTQPVSGTVTANLAAGTNNIGDVDVLTVPAPLSTSGNGTAATALRVTVASDSTGTIAATQSGTWTVRNQDGSGNSLASSTTTPAGTEQALIVRPIPSGTQTVSGTVTANLGTIAGVSTETTLSALNTKIPSNLTVTSTRLLVDGSGVTQPVSGTVAATQSGNWSARIQDGSGNALTSATRGAERALSVQLVDGSGNQVTSFGGGTQYAEDTAHNTGDTGTMLLAVRTDTATARAGTDGDYIPLITDSSGRLWTNLPYDVNSGAAGASTLRTALATRHEAAATPLSIRLSDGSAFITNLATNLAQYNGSAVGASNAIHVQPGTSATFTLNTRHEAAATPLAAKGSLAVFNSDLTLDTNAYQLGDSFCSLLTVTNAVLTAGETAIIESIHLVDVDDVGAPMTLVFFDRSVTLPANNAAWNVSDADMKFSRAVLSVFAGDWKDFGGNRTATFSGLSIPVKPNSGTSIFMGIMIDGAGTFTASGVNISIGFRY